MTATAKPPSVRDVPDVLRQVLGRLDPAARKELFVLTRILFVFGDAGFADCSPELVQAFFLAPALGLPVEQVRRRLLRALHEVVKNPAFDVPSVTVPRIGRRALAREIARRAATRRARVTQEEAVRAERRCIPFYLALREVFGPFTPDTLHYAPVIERAMAFLADRPEARVLDIACGYRLLLKGLAERAPRARLVGADLLPFGANVLARHDQQPFADASVDLVISTSLFDHLVDPPTLVQEAARLVKPDGLVITIATACHVLHLSRNPLTYVEGLISTVRPDVLPAHPLFIEPLSDLPMPWNFFTREQMAAMFEAEFERVEILPLHYGHLRKFGLERVAPHLPVLRDFAGLFMTVASGPRRRAASAAGTASRSASTTVSRRQARQRR